MKAQDYTNQYRKDIEKSGEVAALTNLMKYLLIETVTMAQEKHYTFKSAWKQSDSKWRSIAHNNPDLCLRPDGFHDFCKSKGMLP